MSLKKWVAMLLAIGMLLAMLPAALMEEAIEALDGAETEYVAEAPAEGEAEIASKSVEEGVDEAGDFSLYPEETAPSAGEAPLYAADDVVPNADFVIESGVLTGYTGGSASVVIPAGVTAIGEKAFSDNTAVEQVTIPEGVAEIRASAFSGCTALRTVSLPDTLMLIDERAFYGCASLKAAALPKGLVSVGAYAFANCPALTSATIAEGSEGLVIGDYAFFKSSLSEGIVLPAGLTALGSFVFSKTEVVSVTLKGGMKAMGRKVFADCKKLASVSLPDADDFTALPSGMFSGCDSLTAIAIPKRVTEIGDEAFSDCVALSEVKFGESVAEIGDEAFLNCGSLTAIDLPDSLVAIGDNAFQDCTAVKGLTLSKKLTSVGERAFYHCGSADNPLTVILPDSLASIGRDAFEGFTGAKSVTVSGAAASIGDRAFSDCPNLRWVLIPGASMTFGANVFRNRRDDFVLRCSAGSDALAYAIENDISYDIDDVERLVTVAVNKGFEPTRVYNGATAAPNLYGTDADATFKLSEAFTLTCDGKAIGDDVELVSATAVYSAPDAGTGDVTIAFEIKSKSAEYVYRLKEPAITVKGTTEKAPATVTPDKGQSKLLNAPDPAFTYTVEGLFDGDALTGSLGRAKGETAGEYDFELNDLANPNYTLTLAPGVKFTIEATAVKTFSVSPIPDQTYTGAAIRPAVTVTDGAKYLVEDVDYALTFENNTQVGEASATFTGLGGYKGALQTLKFNIRDRSDRSFEVSPISEQIYTGSAITPALIVRDGANTLRLNLDYIAQYSGNVVEGTASVVVLGAGDYAGVRRSASFAIVRRYSLNDPEVTVSKIPSQSCTGLPITPAFTISYGDALLLEGIDYTATYSDNIEPGRALITVTGMGSYYGTRTIPFTIDERQFLLERKSSLTVNVDDIFTIVVPGDNAVKFKSSKSSVASVEEDGTVTPLKEGKAEITVTLDNKKKLTLKLTVKDPYKPTSIIIEGDKTRTIDLYEYMEDEEPLELTCLILPETASDAEITWKSSNKKVATVDEDGMVTPISAGKATITATAGKKSASVKIKVTNNYTPSRIWFEEGSSAEVTVDDNMDLTLVGLNKQGGEEFISTFKWSWKSSYLDVEVSDDGTSASVTFLKKGKAKISVKSANGKKASFTFKITEESDDDYYDDDDD